MSWQQACAPCTKAGLAALCTQPHLIIEGAVGVQALGPHDERDPRVPPHGRLERLARILRLRYLLQRCTLVSTATVCIFDACMSACGSSCSQCFTPWQVNDGMSADEFGKGTAAVLDAI